MFRAGRLALGSTSSSSLLLMSLLLIAAVGPGCTRANPTYVPYDGGLPPLADVLPGSDIAIIGDGSVPPPDVPTPTDDRQPPRPDIPVPPPPDRQGPPPDGDPPPPPDGPPAETLVGTTCGSDQDCAGTAGRDGFCVTDLPGGYCTAGCDQGNPDSCGPGAVCLDSNQGSFCARTCEAGCRDDYTCTDTFFGIPSPSPVCTPAGNPDAPVGAPCFDQSDCQADQFCLQEFSDGYCTRGCDASQPSSCGTGATCVGGDPNGGGICLATCGRTSDCQDLRQGQGIYGCSFKAFGSPAPERVCLPFDPDAHVGDGCQGESDCTLGGLCITEGSQDPPFPGGYCTDFCDPRSGTGCPGSSSGPGSGRTVCVAIPDQPQLGICLARCDDGGDCRFDEGYTCTAANQSGTLACFPQ